MSDGLEDVVAAHTVLSEVDGAAGRLVMRGHSLDELAGHTSFEEMAALMLDGFVPDLPAMKDLAAALGAARQELFETVVRKAVVPVTLGPVEMIRAMTALIPDGEDVGTVLRLLAAPAVFTAASLRLRQGLALVAPDPSLSQAADTLRMLTGKAPTQQQAAALDTYLVTVADHGLNASTFASRVVASTRAGLVSAVLAGIGALKGPLHGGAPGPVIEMLDAIGAPGNARSWLETALDRGDRLMGFGHRIYRVRDPRADALKGFGGQRRGLCLVQIVELAPHVGPAGGLDDCAVLEERVEPCVGVRLQDALEGGEMGFGVEPLAVLRVGEPDRRRIDTGGRSIIAHIGPQPPGLRFPSAGGENRQGGCRRHAPCRRPSRGA